MEVIQRGRTAVRPAQFPQLSVVPAVSDSELSEPEYVHRVPQYFVHCMLHVKSVENNGQLADFTQVFSATLSLIEMWTVLLYCY